MIANAVSAVPNSLIQKLRAGRAVLWATLLAVSLADARSQVQAVGAVSFALADSWQYQKGADFGIMTLKSDNRFWAIAVYTDSPSSGNAVTDFRKAWSRVLPAPNYRAPGYDPYDMTQTIGYPGKYYDGPSVDQKTYTRLFVLEAGKTCVPVAFVSGSRDMLDGMSHNARAVVGSVRVAPLRASEIRYSITAADLAGFWATGLVAGTNYYDRAGVFKGTSTTAIRSGYTVAANGSFTSKYSGLVNNRATGDEDAGMIELGGGFLTFRGQKHVERYRFVNLQEALDGSSVLTLWPPVDLSQINSSRDSTFFTRSAKK